MSDGIIPLRGRGEEPFALARVDVAAVDLLADGQATTLQAARATIILSDLHQQRAQMTTLLADLQGRRLTGNAQIDKINTDLITAINRGIVQIDLFATQAHLHANEAT